MPIDYNKYPKNWLTEIRPRILKRANNKCELCCIANYSDRANGSKVILTVAHLDHNIENNDDANLKALCQKCHLEIDKEQHATNRKLARKEKADRMYEKMLFDI